MPSIFNAQKAESYEIVMGRWSRRLAPMLIEFAGLAAGERVLDVGCGTGSLAFALAATGRPAAVTGLDYAQIYVDFALAKNADPRVTFQQGDATALPFDDGAFDRALSMIALNFVSEPARAAREMRRVTRSGGTVAAAVWDVRGGFSTARLFLDVASALDPDAIPVRTHYMGTPLTRPGELAALWRAIGLSDVTETGLTMRFAYENFADFWDPIATGEGTMGKYLVGLGAAMRATVEHHVRAAYLCGEPDGPRSFANTAWACRGIVP